MSLIIREHGDEERLDDIRDSTFAILRAELALISDSVVRQQKLDLIFATFILFYGASRTISEPNALYDLNWTLKDISPGEIG